MKKHFSQYYFLPIIIVLLFQSVFIYILFFSLTYPFFLTIIIVERLLFPPVAKVVGKKKGDYYSNVKTIISLCRK